MPADTAGPPLPTQEIAAAFVGARRRGEALPGFPGGAVPPDLEAGYRIQEAALALSPDRPVGWKLGRIPPALEGPLGAGRLTGPIFAEAVWDGADGRPVPVPVFAGGFAAVEAEYVLRLGADSDPAKPDWTLEEAQALVGALHAGVEMAGSPLATINALGPTVVVSDFGNNAGLVLGREIETWRGRPWAELTCETRVNGAVVGRGGAEAVPGGPVESLRVLLELLARRGRTLRAGDLVSTGAATGIHDVAPGDSAEVDFGSAGVIRVTATARDAAPEPRHG